MITFRRSRSSELAPIALLLMSAGMGLAADTNVVRGRVVKTDPAANRITVRPTTGADVTLAVTDASRLENGGKPVPLAEVKEGKRVRITYAEKGGLKSIVLMKPAVTTDEDLGRSVKQTLAAAKNYTFQHKDQYESDVRGVVDDLDDRIAHLEAEAKGSTAATKDRLHARIGNLKAKRATLNDRLEKVKLASADAWGEIKSRVGAAGEDLEKAANELFKE